MRKCFLSSELSLLIQSEPINLRLESICSVLHRTVTSPWLNLPLLCLIFRAQTETRGQQSTARTLGTCTEQWKETAQIYFLPLLLWGFEPNFYIRCLGFKLFIKKILLSKCIKSNDEKLLLKYQYQHSIARGRRISKRFLCSLGKHDQEAAENC